MPDVLKDGLVKTRKKHTCHGCLEPIPVGTTVYHQTCVEDGIYDIYMCDDCRNWCGEMEQKDYWTGKVTKGCRQCPEMELASEGYIRECRADNRNRQCAVRDFSEGD